MTTAIATALALGGGTVAAGVYVNFSARVMPGLSMLTAADSGEAIARMQGFNDNAVQWPFLSAFFGAAVGSAYLVAAPLVSRDVSATSLLAGVGGVLYLVGFLITIAYNVPRNNLLAALDPTAPESEAIWGLYLREWTAANTVRAGLSVAGAISLLASVGVAAFEKASGA